MSRCVCCNKLLNDRELHWKDAYGNFRDTCKVCLAWVLNPNQGEEVVDVDQEVVDEDEDLPYNDCDELVFDKE